MAEMEQVEDFEQQHLQQYQHYYQPHQEHQQTHEQEEQTEDQEQQHEEQHGPGETIEQETKTEYNDSTTESMRKDTDSTATKRKSRSIGRWYIGETLGKGGYSWVKKGYDKTTSKCVALKFMAKADQSWAEEQTKQVLAEIGSLKKIRHPNVMKLYAYNLNAKYPTKNDEKLDCILLVLEYAPGGELFDILYYTSALEAIVARTYFRQFIAGLEACHKAGVAHRDLKPQNLLLDSKFNLKITDFGLSKIYDPATEPLMNTSYVGTKGYQAPELLLNRPYSSLADVFSAGVILFILLTGYPPFEKAHKEDRWFRPLAKGDYQKFWDLHTGCQISNDEDVKDLLQRMLTYNPKNRITIAEIKQHKWFNSKFLDEKELIKCLRNRYRQMEQKRRKDAKKLTDLQNSITRSIEGLNDQQMEVPFYPSNEVEGIWDTYTTTYWKDVYTAVNTVVCEASGYTIYRFDSNTLSCCVKLHNPSLNNDSVIRFNVQVFRSREFHERSLHDSDSEEEPTNPETIYIVRFRRVEGDVLDWKKILNQVLYKKCATVLTGLPKWARSRLNKNKLNVKNANEDDYGSFLAREGLGF